MQISLTPFATARKASLIDDVASLVERTPSHSDEEFMDAIMALVTAGMQPVDLARYANVSIPTLERWSKGIGTPHPESRPAIIRAFVSAARANAQYLRDGCALYRQPAQRQRDAA